mmetsp:Transcript_43647/g.108001  ORF Transcript_43647/g.108001 Transcript_43647/m.108001 type:complete len:207 (+) Transcript_43647:435-1055(+)
MALAHVRRRRGHDLAPRPGLLPRLHVPRGCVRVHRRLLLRAGLDEGCGGAAAARDASHGAPQRRPVVLLHRAGGGCLEGVAHYGHAAHRRSRPLRLHDGAPDARGPPVGGDLLGRRHARHPAHCSGLSRGYFFRGGDGLLEHDVHTDGLARRREAGGQRACGWQAAVRIAQRGRVAVLPLRCGAECDARQVERVAHLRRPRPVRDH